MKSAIIFAAGVIYISGFIGCCTALDYNWGSSRLDPADHRCDAFCDYVAKPVAGLTWPIWIPGVIAFRVVNVQKLGK